MTATAKIILIIFGIFTITGGVMGFVKAGSNASLIAGGVSGILLIAAGVLIHMSMPTPGLILGTVICLALIGRFLPAFLKTHAMMPAGMTSILGIITLLFCIAAFLRK